MLANNGHANGDNYAELYSTGASTKMMSARLTYATPLFILELEPYTLSRSDVFDTKSVGGTFKLNNNYVGNINANNRSVGFRQSRVILHYKGIGIGYGRMSHWWSPGFHSALALSSNAPSQETYAVGTFQDLRFGRLAIGAQIIAMPYTSKSDIQLYFSGLKAHMTYHSNPVVTLGFHRTYLSGDFSNLSDRTNFKGTWSLEDAVRLVIEPLFGQNKKKLDYTVPGTPGFDLWDEVLTGFIKLTFPDEYLEVYADVASDDNRANITDLKAHWDHTLGYLLGFNKYSKLSSLSLFYGVEYLSLKRSNTEKFWRPYNYAYYAYDDYDYFTYQGRRMGAHSGSSSDDLILMLGFGNEISMAFVSWNKERHGIKSMTYPEIKSELALTYYHTISKHHSAFITMEYEHIRNFSFIQDEISDSKLLWFGYAYSLR